ncbi:MAG TPA: hypothetical protein VLD57_11770 [Blastocatellia bacterium]|nr:hypothetical protein [Blastocatellia bacterium]
MSQRAAVRCNQMATRQRAIVETINSLDNSFQPARNLDCPLVGAVRPPGMIIGREPDFESSAEVGGTTREDDASARRASFDYLKTALFCEGRDLLEVFPPSAMRPYEFFWGEMPATVGQSESELSHCVTPGLRRRARSYDYGGTNDLFRIMLLATSPARLPSLAVTQTHILRA